jgi:tetratricopeptide (TPR) repeat protein
MASPSKNQSRKPYVPAVTPRLRVLLTIVFFLTALLGANSLYLVAVTVLESIKAETYQNYFYQYMFLGHLVLGLLLIGPFFVFGVFHIRNTWRRKNRRAVWIGYLLFGTCLVLIGTGLLLTRAGPFEVRVPATRAVFYWLHVIAPLVAVWLYCLHRLAGPPIKWKVGLSYLFLAVFAGMITVWFQQSDPRAWYQVGSPEGSKYFEPSLARTSNGKFIPAVALNNNAYCQECHADVHRDWAESAHRFSSFNNPAYLASVRETRQFSLDRDGTVQRSRFCAGCHDPVPFFSGQFDDPNFDDMKNPTAHAGITCTSCHAITNINSPRGNADYTIEEPLHYPFAYSQNDVLKWVNRQLVKAKPSFHKKTFLKPFHRTGEFCGTCHKVHLPEELNDYKFLRGQNHYDSFLLSGVSGHGARSFYYPEKAESNCNRCHMPLAESTDFGARDYDDSGVLAVHSHLFPGGNTALPHWRKKNEVVRMQQEILEDCARVDIFGIREEGKIDGELTAPLGPEDVALKPGASYLLETVIRTLKLGHHFTQGTSDSNEIWLEVTVKSGERLIGQSGKIDENGNVDPWAYFVNSFVLDRQGNRIDRRNAQDIFIPLYDHQIPPGVGQTIHYGLQVPEDVTEPLTVEVKLQYRKFDQNYVEYIMDSLTKTESLLGEMQALDPQAKELPITTIATDQFTFSIEGQQKAENTTKYIPVWQRWNDYGIGLLLKGTGQLRQAEAAFAEVEKHNRYDGPLNLARLYFREGRLDEAVSAVERASQFDAPIAPPWTMAWLSGIINRQQGHLGVAEENFRAVLSPPNREMRDRGFDFRLDYVVINLLGQTLFDRARQLRGEANQEHREKLIQSAIAEFHKTLEIDPENVDAHFNLGLLYTDMKDEEHAAKHKRLHEKYRPDDNARGLAVAAARLKYPAANHASAAVVLYGLQRFDKDGTAE